MLRYVTNGLRRRRVAPPAVHDLVCPPRLVLALKLTGKYQICRQCQPHARQTQTRLHQSATAERRDEPEPFQNRGHEEGGTLPSFGFRRSDVSQVALRRSTESPMDTLSDGNAWEMPTNHYEQAVDGKFDDKLLSRNEEDESRADRTPGPYDHLEGHPNVWAEISPNLLFKKVLPNVADSEPLKRIAASARSNRLPIVLVQLHLRHQRAWLPSDISDSLPDQAEWEKTLRTLEVHGHSLDDLDHYLWILRGKSDEQQRKRFFSSKRTKPLFLANYLSRPSAIMFSASTLDGLIDYYRDHFSSSSLSWEETHASEIGLRLTRVEACNTLVASLAGHSHRVDARYCVKVADFASKLIKRQAEGPWPKEEIYWRQCSIFNASLKALRPRPPKYGPITRAFPNGYIWESQKSLLSFSAGFEKPLQLDAEAFRSIRETLAGQAKSHEEMHNSLRQADTWPPYLRPGDGVDEQTEPEENWSRTVQAGMMMQEAGFGLHEHDDALNVLQGMGTDGTPTIQQRVLTRGKREVDLWEASIQATRNTWEAWSNFQRPPSRGMEHTSRHYAVMFQKLFLRDSRGNSEALPGDKALNFPTKAEVNLTEHEKARLRPPTVEQLYRQMLSSGIRPTGHCLLVLIANASSVEVADGYLRDSDLDPAAVHSLTTDTTQLQAFRLSPALLAAYVTVCAQASNVAKRPWTQLRRAMQITNVCQESYPHFQTGSMWGLVLKNMSQRHAGLGVSLAYQLDALRSIVEQTRRAGRIGLTTFIQFAKCLRKIARRELDTLLKDLASNDAGKSNYMTALYDRSLSDETSSTDEDETNGSKSVVLSFLKAAKLLKTEFLHMSKAEQSTLDALQAYEVPTNQVMTSRSDPVRPGHAHEYMLTLAYLGEFKEMGKFLGWLVRQWGDPRYVAAWQGTGMQTTEADFVDTMCAFRLLGEPMLKASAVASVQDSLRSSGLEWPWPDDDVLDAYVQRLGDDTIITLSRVVEWIQFRGRQR